MFEKSDFCQKYKQQVFFSFLIEIPLKVKISKIGDFYTNKKFNFIFVFFFISVKERGTYNRFHHC